MIGGQTARAMIGSALLSAIILSASIVHSQEAPKSNLDDNGTVHNRGDVIPYSDLASPEARRNFVETNRGIEKVGNESANLEQRLDQLLMVPNVQRLRTSFAVDISATKIAGVPVDIVTPKGGVGFRNRNRILINLHGGGMTGGDAFAKLAGQMESIPIASIGNFRVITINYREAPDWHFPAASEDVAKVYGDLLRRYRPDNIGIYGCSSGAVLTAESLAWFQAHNLPRPGAIGLFGAGASEGAYGDGLQIDVLLFNRTGQDSKKTASTREAEEKAWKDLLPYYKDVSLEDPMVSPVYSDSILRRFPPTLLISGTRDIGISSVVNTHARLVDLGVKADLHVWEGMPHCSYAEPIANPEVPENRQAWAVIARFFDRNLGRNGK